MATKTMTMRTTMTDFRDIYADVEHARAYDQLVRCEDYQGNLGRYIRVNADLSRARILDMGSGTGRVAALMADTCRSLTICDRAPAMLAVARERLPAYVRIDVADNTALPYGDGSFDVVTAGWSFGHATEWLPDVWQTNVRAAVDEMLRVLAPGGIAIIFETLGSGVVHPAPPTDNLRACYAIFEDEYGFERTALATDYRFESAAEAARLTAFFFGVAMDSTVQPDGRAIVPEWTGAWQVRRARV
jgi:ubiquinone/menaquinone biosynthesis C-methylase UbiE